MTVTRMKYREYLTYRKDTFAHQEQVARKQRDEYDRQMERWHQIYQKVDHDQRTISRQNPSGGRLLKKKMKSIQAMGRRFEREKENFIDFPETEAAILTAFDDTIRLPAGKRVIDVSLPALQIGKKVLAVSVSLHVGGGEHIGITGRNGAGKSTLLQRIADELMQRTDIKAAYMPQNYADLLDEEQSPVDFLAPGATKEEITRARTYMGNMRFTHEEMTGRIGSLSGGQKAKILLLDMVLKGANVLLLDEPTRNFSPLSGPVIRDALRRFGGTILSVSHDRKYLSEVCDRVYQLTEEGLIPFQG